MQISLKFDIMLLLILNNIVYLQIGKHCNHTL